MTVRGTALGFHFSIASADRDLEGFWHEALRHLPPNERWAAGAATQVQLGWVDDGAVAVEVGGRMVFTGGVTPALAHVMNAINVGATRAAGDDPVLHCGVVSSDNRVVLLPGRPGAGKSTTTTALLLQGYGYLSDEAAPITPDGCIRPYPKPVVVGRGSWPSVGAASAARIRLVGEQLDAWWIDPERLSCAVVPNALPVGAVVAPQYRAGSSLEIERMSRAEATAVMASNTFNMHDHGVAGVERTAALTNGIPLLRVTFGDVQQVCDLIASELGG